MYDLEQDKSSIEAAAEAAQKVNAMLIAKGKLKPSQIAKSTLKSRPLVTTNLYFGEVCINDLPSRVRNTLTRGATQGDISRNTSTAISTRGRYLTNEDKTKNPTEKSLYLSIQASDQYSVDRAVKHIHTIVESHLLQPSLGAKRVKEVRENRFIRQMEDLKRSSTGAAASTPMDGLITGTGVVSPNTLVNSTVYLDEKVYIGMGNAPERFGLRERLLGPGGSYLNHIAQETGGKVSIRGKGSGLSVGLDSLEPMYIYIQHEHMTGLRQAQCLVNNLLQTVLGEYQAWMLNVQAQESVFTPGSGLSAAPPIVASIAPSVVPSLAPPIAASMSPPIVAPMAPPIVAPLSAMSAAPITPSMPPPIVASMAPPSIAPSIAASMTSPVATSIAPPRVSHPTPILTPTSLQQPASILQPVVQTSLLGEAIQPVQTPLGTAYIQQSTQLGPPPCINAAVAPVPPPFTDEQNLLQLQLEAHQKLSQELQAPPNIAGGQLAQNQVVGQVSGTGQIISGPAGVMQQGGPLNQAQVIPTPTANTATQMGPSQGLIPSRLQKPSLCPSQALSSLNRKNLSQMTQTQPDQSTQQKVMHQQQQSMSGPAKVNLQSAPEKIPLSAVRVPPLGQGGRTPSVNTSGVDLGQDRAVIGTSGPNRMTQSSGHRMPIQSQMSQVQSNKPNLSQPLPTTCHTEPSIRSYYQKDDSRQYTSDKEPKLTPEAPYSVSSTTPSVSAAVTSIRNQILGASLEIAGPASEASPVGVTKRKYGYEEGSNFKLPKNKIYETVAKCVFNQYCGRPQLYPQPGQYSEDPGQYRGAMPHGYGPQEGTGQWESAGAQYRESEQQSSMDSHAIQQNHHSHPHHHHHRHQLQQHPPAPHPSAPQHPSRQQPPPSVGYSHTPSSYHHHYDAR